MCPDAGRDIPLRSVPKADRSFVEWPGVAKPEASFLFAAPAGAVTVTCDDVQATPVQELWLGPAPGPLFDTMNWGSVLVGPVLFLLGPTLALLPAARRRSRPD